MSIPFVGQRFSLSEFKTYLQSLRFGKFKPEFVTLHHTATPSLAQRPKGFTAQHLQNLRSYYENDLGWSGAPHIFIDDQPKGIIVFQRLDCRGVHAASFNRNSWAIEMLGNYDTEDPNSGRGKKVVDTAINCIKAMNEFLKIGPETLKFHRDDPKTKKSCPGLRVIKQDLIKRLANGS